MWNPETLDDEGDEDSREGVKSDDEGSDDESQGEHFMFFQEIASKVAPIIDELFPVDSGVRIVSCCRPVHCMLPHGKQFHATALLTVQLTYFLPLVPRLESPDATLVCFSDAILVMFCYFFHSRCPTH